MQDTLIRVLVMAVGLITYPREDPTIQEHHDTQTSLQDQEELLRNIRNLDQEETAVSPDVSPDEQLHGKIGNLEQEVTAVSPDVSPDEEELHGNIGILDQEVTAVSPDVSHNEKEPHSRTGALHAEAHNSTFIPDPDMSIAETGQIPPAEDTKPSFSDEEHLGPEGNSDSLIISGDSHVTDQHLNVSQEKEEEIVMLQWTSQTDEVKKEEGMLQKNAQLQLDQDQSSSDLQPEHLETGGSFTKPLTAFPPLLHAVPHNEVKGLPQKSFSDVDGDLAWYLWNLYSIISIFHVLRKYMRSSKSKHGENSRTVTRTSVANKLASEVQLPDSPLLLRFYDKCFQGSPNEAWRVGEFVEGLASDLLETMRSLEDGGVALMMEDCQVLDSGCDVIVPIIPTEPYRFQCQLWNTESSDDSSNMEGCAKIKMVKSIKSQNGCHCTSSDNEEDVVCLLHCGEAEVEEQDADVQDSPLCVKSTPFLSKSQLAKWFQSTVRRAWAQISHKYEFELLFRSVSAPTTLTVRFRSGRKIPFSVSPVVRFNDTDGYLSTSSTSSTNADHVWSLSLTTFEDQCVKLITRTWPKDCCYNQTLDILNFLNRKQVALTGRSYLNKHHLKMVVLQLLLSTEAAAWNPELLACRLRESLCLLEDSLQQRLLNHVLIRDKFKSVMQVSAALAEIKSFNLFRPLVVDDCLYNSTVAHFQELLKNAHLLIEEYAL